VNEEDELDAWLDKAAPVRPIKVGDRVRHLRGWAEGVVEMIASPYRQHMEIALVITKRHPVREGSYIDVRWLVHCGEGESA
jgi:hypothetical protein